MRRVLSFLVAAILALAFAWFIAGLPGRITAQFGSTTVELATPVAALALLLLLVLLAILYRIFAALLGIPRRAGGWRARSRRHAGDAAVTRALVALAAGDKAESRREAGRARNLLGDTAQTLMLSAEASRLSGRDDEAANVFRELTQRSDAAFLGYRGLLRQAIAREDWQEASALARQAESAQPVRRLAAARTVPAVTCIPATGPRRWNWPRPIHPKRRSRRRRPRRNRIPVAPCGWHAGRGNRTPALPAAALAYAERLRREGREKKAQSVIRHSWTVAPHPDLADFALAPVSDPMGRVKAARLLAQSNPQHVESRLLLARTELNAGLTGEARHQAEAAREAGLNQRRLWLLMADIAEAEHGDSEEGREAQREALRQAASADPDPVWQCTVCRTPHRIWAAACRSCEAPGSLRWMSPETPGTFPVPVLRD